MIEEWRKFLPRHVAVISNLLTILPAEWIPRFAVVITIPRIESLRSRLLVLLLPPVRGSVPRRVGVAGENGPVVLVVVVVPPMERR